MDELAFTEKIKLMPRRLWGHLAKKGYSSSLMILIRSPYFRRFISSRVVDYTEKWAYFAEQFNVLFLPVNTWQKRKSRLAIV
jgi:hypothetical protein